jgi:hypothetical protein
MDNNNKTGWGWLNNIDFVIYGEVQGSGGNTNSQNF